jgi:hypothetical protein
VFSYTTQTLYVAIFATDTHGAIKQVLETINLIPKSPPPTPPATPFSTNTVAQPLATGQFIPLNATLITVILAAGLTISVVAAYVTRGRKRNENK